MRLPGRIPARLVAPVIVAGVFVLLAAGAAVSSTPGVCASCHVMAPLAEGLAASPHASTDCYSCHLEGGAAGWLRFKTAEFTRMYPRALFGAKTPGDVGSRVTRGACESCHTAVGDSIVEARGLRIDHAACAAAPRLCADCHNQTAHGDAVRWIRTFDMDDCTACHSTVEAPLECDSCHQGRLESERLVRGAWQVTHGPEWATTHGMGDSRTCVTCHPRDYCVRCHNLELPHPAEFGRTHSELALQDDATCDTCHPRDVFCTGCHGYEMPHPPTFLEEHPAIADGYEDASCVTCHFAEDCTACHVKHTHPGSTRGTLGGNAFPSPTGPAGGGD